jgi:hypothetical protein
MEANCDLRQGTPDGAPCGPFYHNARLCAVSEEAITSERETGQGGARRLRSSAEYHDPFEQVSSMFGCLQLGKDRAFGPLIAVPMLSEFGNGVTNRLQLRNLRIEFSDMT